MLVESISQFDAVKYISPTKMVDGDVVEGIYKGCYTTKWNKTCYVILQDEGREIRLSARKRLDDFFAQVHVGCFVKIIYDGKKKLANGNTLQTFRCFHDPKINIDHDTLSKFASEIQKLEDSKGEISASPIGTKVHDFVMPKKDIKSSLLKDLNDE